MDLRAGATQERAEFYRRISGNHLTPLWEVLGSLRWGVSCASMLEWFTSGRDPSVERAMIARRVSENELDLMRLHLRDIERLERRPQLLRAIARADDVRDFHAATPPGLKMKCVMGFKL